MSYISEALGLTLLAFVFYFLFFPENLGKSVAKVHEGYIETMEEYHFE